MVVAMAEGGVDFDELQSQKCMIKKSLESEMKAGDTWYLIDPMWMRQWRRHVGYDESEIQHLGQAFPGPIDNSALIKDDGSGELRDQMLDGGDYELLPEDGWTLLVDWYGLADQQTPISRKVVEHGLYVKQTKVEVYLLPLKLCQHSELDKHVTKKFSKEDTIGHLERVMRETFGVSATRSVRVWSRYTTNTYELMSNRDATISSLGLYTGQIVVLEVQNTDGSWPRPTPSCSGTVNSLGDGPASSSSMTTRYGAAAAAGSDSSSNGGAYRPGLCGLANLGNTCFMNSVLQCLSNTPPLCQYFTSGRHLAELNTDNPLGMRGEIAKAFGSLVQEMWSGRYQSTMPRAFKYQVSRFAPQFSGYQQHDSQEMLTFILDALNEDLNRVRKKPYVELKDANGRPDAVVAAEAWSNYLKRNDSIISDLFFGLLKSTVVCPECPKVSVTFDPFCTLQLPLPVKRDRTVEVCVVFADPSRRPVNYRVTVSKQGQVRDLTAALQKLCRVPQERLVLTELYQRRFHTVFTGHELLKTVSDKDVIYAYERPTLQEGYSQMAVYNRCSETGAVETTPFFVTLRRGQSSYAELRAAVDRCMSRYTRLLPAAQWRESAAVNDNNGVLDSDDDEECEEAVAAGEDCGMDTQPSPSEHDIVTEEEATPYRLVLVNAGGTSVLRRRLHEESGQLQLPAGCALQLVWQPRAFSVCVDLQEERSREQHQSVQQTQQHNSRQHRPVIQLSECLDLFTTTEKLGKDDAWYCPDCKKHQEATKKFDLWSLPDVLIVHLKRFSYTRIFRDKIDLHVEFPTRQLDMRSHLINPRPANNAIYDLIGVSNHYGGLGGGHYVAMCRSRNSGEWYNFDDSSVTLSSEDSVCNKAAYVLFYMRRGVSSGGPTAESSASSAANGDCDMESAVH